MKYQLKPVTDKADWAEFINLPFDIYGDDPTWVPPLRIAVKDILDVKKNPFFRHAVMHPVLARREDGEVVGRIVGVIDENHNRTYKEKTAFFGFFESYNDQELADALLNEVDRWAKGWGMNNLRGPLNPSTNGDFGLLVDGFDQPHSVMTSYNPPYYSELFESCGLRKQMDFYAYDVDHTIPFDPRVFDHAERLKKRAGITMRPINTKKFQEEAEEIIEIYNEAWEENWGFVRMEPEEMKHLVKELKMIYDPNMLLIVEVKGEMAAFGLALPDVNQALRSNRSGRLFPVGLAKLLWNMKGPRRKKVINRCRIYGLGIRKKFRHLGIGPLLYAEYYKRGPAHGYPIGEASWILENNVQMNGALEQMRAKRTKTWRLYDRRVQ